MSVVRPLSIRTLSPRISPVITSCGTSEFSLSTVNTITRFVSIFSAEIGIVISETTASFSKPFREISTRTEEPFVRFVLVETTPTLTSIFRVTGSSPGEILVTTPSCTPSTEAFAPTWILSLSSSVT